MRRHVQRELAPRECTWTEPGQGDWLESSEGVDWFSFMAVRVSGIDRVCLDVCLHRNFNTWWYTRAKATKSKLLLKNSPPAPPREQQRATNLYATSITGPFSREQAVSAHLSRCWKVGGAPSRGMIRVRCWTAAPQQQFPGVRIQKRHLRC